MCTCCWWWCTVRQFVVCGRHSNPVPAENSDILISSQSPLPPFPYLKYFPTFCLNHHHIQDFLLCVFFLHIWDFLSNPQQDFHSSCHRFVCPAFNQISLLLLLGWAKKSDPVKVHLGIVNLSNKRNFWWKSNLKVLAGGGAGDRQPDRRLECVLVVGTSRLLSNHSRLKFFEYYPLAASTERNTEIQLSYREKYSWK